MDYTIEYNKIMSGAGRLNEYDLSSVNILKKAFNLAQKMNDDELILESGEALIEASIFSDENLTAISILPKLLTIVDKSSISDDRFLWEYKWVLETLLEYPHISKQQMFDALNDMRDRHGKLGYNDKVYYEHLFHLYYNLGMKEEAQDSLDKFYEFSLDYNPMSSCKACIAHDVLLYYDMFYMFDKVMEAAEPILNGSLSCNNKPIATYSYLTVVYLKKRDYKSAAKMFNLYEKKKKGYAGKFNIDPSIYLIKMKEYTKAINELKEGNRFSYLKIKNRNYLKYCYVYWYLAHNLIQDGFKEVKITFSKDFPFYDSSNVYDTHLLNDFFKKESQTLANQFDLRNGNRSVSSFENTIFNL